MNMRTPNRYAKSSEMHFSHSGILITTMSSAQDLHSVTTRSFLGRPAVAVSVLQKKKVAVSHSAKNKKTKERPYTFQRMENPHQSSESCTINLQLLPKRMSHQVWLLLSQKLREIHRNKKKKKGIVKKKIRLAGDLGTGRNMPMFMYHA